MAIEKRLQTRILNKVDTLENWNKSTLKIKQGEICFATVAASAGTGLTEPVVMAKIGTSEEKTFSELPWSFYAKASDVVAACKSEASLKTFISGVITDSKLATSSDMEALSGRVATLEGDVNTAGSVAKAIKDAIDALDLTNELAKKVDKVEGKDLIATSEIERLLTLHNYDDTQIKADIAKKADSETMATELGKKVDKVEGKSLILDSEITRLSGMADGATKVEASTVNGKIKINGVETVVYTHPEKHAMSEITGLSEEFATKVDKVSGKSLVSDSEITKLAGVSEGANKVEASSNGKIKINGVDTVVYTHPEKHTVSEISDFAEKVEAYGYATKTELEGVDGKFANYVTSASYATDKQGIEEDIADRYTKSEADGKFALIADAYDDTALSNRVKAIEDDYLKGADKTELSGLITAEKTRAEGIEGELRSDVDAIAKDYLVEADKTELQEQITANANAISLLTNGVSAEEVDGVNDLIKYVKDHGTEVTGMKEDIAENAKAISDHETLAAETYETKTDAAQKLTDAKKHATDLNTAMNTRVEALEAIDHSHKNESVLSGITAEKVAAWDSAEQNAKDYADGLAGNYAEAEHDHVVADITDFESVVEARITAKGYATTGEVATAKSGAEAKAAELDAALKTELQAEIDADVKVVADNLADYKTSNDAALEAAKTDAANKSAVVLAEAQAYADSKAATAKSEAIADAAAKYEEIGVAKGLVDALGTMSKEAAADYVKKSEAPGYTDILTKTDAQGLYQAKGEYYTKTEADAAFTNSTEVDSQIDTKIAALKLADTYQAKGEYASAEQGSKADTAIQSVTSVAGNGIKATTTGTSVSLDWDSEVVFVFDCGSSVEG